MYHQHQQQQNFQLQQQQLAEMPANGASVVDSFSSSSCSAGSTSPSLSLRIGTAEDTLSTIGDQRTLGENGSIAGGMKTATQLQQQQQINLQIFVPELQMQKCLTVALHELVWDIKRRLFEALPQPLPQHFNFGLFLPPCDGRAGKFLLEDRPIQDYPFHDCVPYVELKYKKRVYKMLRLDEKALRTMHSKTNLRKFCDAIQQRNAQKIERYCSQGLDPNFHDTHGETPLTLAAGIPASREVLVQLVGGGAHLDYRNTEGQTGMHKAAFLSIADNVRTLLELGASPNYRDLIGLTPLYYNMLSPESNVEVAEMLLAEAADLDIVDMHGNTALHQACKNGLCKHVEQLLYYGADINARNVNGNTPLHVCAVNGRVDCAQVLLYRGADPTLLNRQGQTAIHVAQIVGNPAVTEVIAGHSPHNIMPFREPPRLNPRRRMSSRQFNGGSSASSSAMDGVSVGGQQQQQHQMMRRRSLSHCSSASTIASVQLAQQQQHPPPQHPNPHHRYSAATTSTTVINGLLPPSHPMESPSPSVGSLADYGTLRRIPTEAVPHPHPGCEPNTPRILVIPRGPKGFGFILRGARHVDSMQLDFRPNAAVPALQFFEGVDMQGMAMRAGLRPGDFLLEINGVDVRAASHEEVVQLIHQSGDTITLKVITVDLDQLAATSSQSQQQIYAATTSSGNYATLGRRNHSVPRTLTLNGTTANSAVSAAMPPMVPTPPQRNPSTTLSFGRATGAATTQHGSGNSNGAAGQTQQFSTAADIPAQQQQQHQRPSSLSVGTLLPPAPPPPSSSPSAQHFSQWNCNGNGQQQQQQQMPIAMHPNVGGVVTHNTLDHHSPSSSSLPAVVHPSSVQMHNNLLPVVAQNPHAQQQQPQPQPIRCASVKLGRASAVRRISAAELEHLMVQQRHHHHQQQQQQQLQQQSIVFGPEQPANGAAAAGGNATGPKKFTSVNEMKRRKQPNMRANSISDNPTNEQHIQMHLYAQMQSQEYAPGGGTLLKPSNSTPDLQQQHHQSSSPDVVFRPVLRPKTPPPPPPPGQTQRQQNATMLMDGGLPPEPAEHPPPPTSSAATHLIHAPPASTSNAPPPAPPPPPPPNLLLRTTTTNQASSQSNATSMPSSSSAIPSTTTTKAVIPAAAASSSTEDCRGVSAEALRSVRLKPVGTRTTETRRSATMTTAVTGNNRNGGTGKWTNNNGTQIAELAANAAASTIANNKAAPSNATADFDADLRLALARRRSKVRGTEEADGENGGTNEEHGKNANGIGSSKGETTTATATMMATTIAETTSAATTNPVGAVLVGRYTSGLSLRESVLENVSGVAAAASAAASGCCKHGQKANSSSSSSHSPPGGFMGTKKDSGYTSSRTSLEPSECGDCCCEQQQQMQQQQQQHNIIVGSGNGGGANSNNSRVHHQNGAICVGATLPVQHRVQVISQQLLEQQAAAQPPAGLCRLSPKPMQLPTSTTTNTSSMLRHHAASSPRLLDTNNGNASSSSSLHQHHQQQHPPNVRIPPIDYDLCEEEQEVATMDDSMNPDRRQIQWIDASATTSACHQQQQQQQRPFTRDKDSIDACRSSGSESTTAAAAQSRSGPSADSTGEQQCSSSSKQEEQMRQQRTATGEYRQKPVPDWLPEDVCEWLLELELDEHVKAFASVQGPELLRFDRARYTALGVTRIAHRQKMEQSLKVYHQRE